MISHATGYMCQFLTAGPLIMCILFIGGCVAGSFTGTGLEPHDFAYTKPPENGDGWHTAHVSNVGLDPRKIDRLLADIHMGILKNIYAVMVAKDGVLVDALIINHMPSKNWFSVIDILMSIENHRFFWSENGRT